MFKFIHPVLLFFCCTTVVAQQTITLSEAQASLQKNNLLLLAEQYNITASQAAVIQAKIWEQPYLTAEANIINPSNNTYVNVGSNGQKALAVQQLIYLGGKKKNEVAFAKSNVELAQLQFEQLLRNLKFQLSQNFYSIYFDRQKIKTLEFQINKLDTLLKVYQVQADKGNVPLKEVVRLQSLVLSLKNDRNNILKDVISNQQDLLLITGLNQNIFPEVNETEIINSFRTPKYTKDSLLQICYINNPEYLSVSKIIDNNELYLKWQKSLAVPDLTTGISYDQHGGAFQNQVNLTIGIPLTLWNRNKGNIKIAEAQLSRSKLDKDFKKAELQNKFEGAWQLWEQQQKQLNSITGAVNTNLESVYRGILSNFGKRNITLLEFTDFMESYNQTTFQINEIKKQWTLSGLNLNYITNTDIF